MSSTSQTDVWVIGFPKSGNTWISYLSSFCFNLPFGNFGNPKESQRREWVKALTSGGNDWPILDGYRSVQKTHKLPNQVPLGNGLVIYAIRDPRDVFVSYHYFMRSSNAKILGRLRYFILGLVGKRSQIKWFLSSWNKHVQLWTGHTKLIISYDKMLSEGPDYLAKIFGGSPFVVDKEVIRTAYDKFSFKNMSGGRKPGAEDQKSFFRKGISGDWQNHFNAQEVALFQKSLELYKRSII